MNDVSIMEKSKKYSTSNEVVKGILELLDAAKPDEAAELYSHCQEDIGFILMARASVERSFQAKLGKMFFIAKDFEKAAMVLETNGEYKRAAELYESTDQYEQAAEMWVKVGDLGRAALNHEKRGDWQTAADLYSKTQNFSKAAYCFEKAINHFLAGKYYLQLGKHQKSMELLQKVKKDEASYLEATVLIGNILSMHGYTDIAENKYRSVIKTTPAAPESLVVYYNLAKLLEKNGKMIEAATFYREVAGLDSNYKDIQDRLKACQMEVAEQIEVQAEQDQEPLEIIDNMQCMAEEVLTRHDEKPVPGQTKQQNHIVSIMEGFEFLKSTPLFETLSLADMKRLWNICEEKYFEPGQMLIEQFQPGRALYIVKKGTVVVQRVDSDKVTDLVTLPKGSYVGEMSLINQAATSARVVAGAGGVSVFEIHRDRFDELLASDDKISIKLYKVFIDTLCERLRKTTEELAEAKTKTI